MRLLLFDIDGTLIKPSSVGRRVLKKSLLEIYGVIGPIDEYSFSGKTDLTIIYELMSAAGLEEGQIALGLSDLYDSMAKWGRTLFSLDNLEPCPGVLEILEILHNRRDFVLGLQTGNSESTAYLKLKPSGIDPSYFEIGAFGSDAADRNELLPIAWQRAHHKTKERFSGANTIVIGDTPSDIVCAKANGAFSFAVASGFCSYDILYAHQPDIILKDLSNRDEVIKILTE